ncbi:6010_t:CDS:2, partial [Gigaspora margarita]
KPPLRLKYTATDYLNSLRSSSNEPPLPPPYGVSYPTAYCSIGSSPAGKVPITTTQITVTPDSSELVFLNKSIRQMRANNIRNESTT